MEDRRDFFSIIKLKGRKKKAFDAFPSSENWRMGMEVTRQDEGPEAFHRGVYPEPGYIEGMRNGYALMLKNIDHPLSADMLAAIHDICVKSISDEQIEKSEVSFRDNITTQYTIQPIENDPRRGYFSKQGFLELMEKIQQHEQTSKGKDRFCILIGEPQMSSKEVDPTEDDLDEVYEKILSSKYAARFISMREDASFIRQRTQQHIDKYYEDVSKVRSDDEKLDLILKVIKDLEQLHPFPDANGRTISMIAFNKLLIENGFSPVMQDNPNRIDGFGSPYSGSDELKQETLKGMKNFNDYCIDDLRQLIKKIPANEITSMGAKDLIRKQLSDNPSVAMAQINALFIEIENNKLSVKSQSFSLLRGKNNPEKNTLLGILKTLYKEKVDESLSLENRPAVSSDVYKEIIARHHIIESDPKLKAMIHEKVDDGYRQDKKERMSTGK